jgi:nickel/cobalt exporter
MGRRSSHAAVIASLALLTGVALPVVALAHPLGNFTINHYAGIAVAPAAIQLDVVIDMAEIPAFQERQTMDANGDGSVDDAEADAGAAADCATLLANLHLSRDGRSVVIVGSTHAASFPPGAGGLSTLRLECGYAATLEPAIGAATTLAFSDGSYPERIGWREIVATGDAVELDTNGLPPTSPSQRLTSYPADMIAQPLDIRSATLVARPGAGGPAASAAATATASTRPTAVGATTPTGGAPGPSGAVVPGGVSTADLPDIFRSADLTPIVAILSLITAAALGAGHALTPGHGKTLMAAYLVGSRGTPVHAVSLGLSVAVSHTLGILGLALLIVGAQGVLPADVVVRAAPVVAAGTIVAIGGWMLGNEVRRRVRRREPNGRPDDAHGHDHPHPRARNHAHAVTASVDAHRHDRDAARVDHEFGHAEHSHGGVRHSHLPAAGSTLSWRGLFALGLAGGLIPSTSALLILLGSMAAGRAAFGLVLVVGFGLGMALVMSGVGLAMILARTRLDRMPSRSGLGRLATAAPLLASVAVLTLGLVLTWQAVAGRPVL